jgi:hypothetical protein
VLKDNIATIIDLRYEEGIDRFNPQETDAERIIREKHEFRLKLWKDKYKVIKKFFNDVKKAFHEPPDEENKDDTHLKKKLEFINANLASIGDVIHETIETARKLQQDLSRYLEFEASLPLLAHSSASFIETLHAFTVQKEAELESSKAILELQKTKTQEIIARRRHEEEEEESEDGLLEGLPDGVLDKGVERVPEGMLDKGAERLPDKRANRRPAGETKAQRKLRQNALDAAKLAKPEQTENEVSKKIKELDQPQITIDRLNDNLRTELGIKRTIDTRYSTLLATLNPETVQKLAELKELMISSSKTEDKDSLETNIISQKEIIKAMLDEQKVKQPMSEIEKEINHQISINRQIGVIELELKKNVDEFKSLIIELRALPTYKDYLDEKESELERKIDAAIETYSFHIKPSIRNKIELLKEILGLRISYNRANDPKLARRIDKLVNQSMALDESLKSVNLDEVEMLFGRYAEVRRQRDSLKGGRKTRRVKR